MSCESGRQAKLLKVSFSHPPLYTPSYLAECRLLCLALKALAYLSLLFPCCPRHLETVPAHLSLVTSLVTFSTDPLKPSSLSCLLQEGLPGECLCTVAVGLMSARLSAPCSVLSAHYMPGTEPPSKYLQPPIHPWITGELTILSSLVSGSSSASRCLQA